MSETHPNPLSGTIQDSIDHANTARTVDNILPDSLEAANRVLGGFEKQMRQDTKTTLLNPAGLKHEYDELVAAHNLHRRKVDQEHPDQPNSLLLIDLDKFKEVNNKLGYSDADKLLRITGEFLKEHLIRDTDKAGRFGGDEFVVLLPGTTTEEAAIVAERMRASLEKIRGIEGKDISPTMSVGVGTLNPELSFEEAIKEANEALFEAKESGRNQVVIFENAA